MQGACRFEKLGERRVTGGETRIKVPRNDLFLGRERREMIGWRCDAGQMQALIDGSICHDS